MRKNIICIECPAGCSLLAEIEDGKAVHVEGGKCPKGAVYARAEIESPARILTSTVRTSGLELKMLPVRTSRPIPKDRLFDAMMELKNAIVKREVEPGDIIVKDLLGTGADIVSTRRCGYGKNY